MTDLQLSPGIIRLFPSLCPFSSILPSDQKNRIAHDTADAVNIYTQNKMMPMFSRLDLLVTREGQQLVLRRDSKVEACITCSVLWLMMYIKWITFRNITFIPKTIY